MSTGATWRDEYLLDDPSGEQLERDRNRWEFAGRRAQHLSRAQVTAVLRARKSGHAYPGRHSLGSPLVTERTIDTLAEGDAALLIGSDGTLTVLGADVAVILLAEARRYL